MALASATGSPVLLAVAHYFIGLVLYPLGELEAASEHLEQAVAIGAPQGAHGPLAEPTMQGRGYLGTTQAILGYPARALGLLQHGLAAARQSGHVYSEGLIGVHFLCFYTLVEDFAAAARAYHEVARIAHEHEFHTLVLILQAHEGLIALQEGRAADPAEIRQRIAARRAAGLRMEVLPQLGMLGLAYLRLGAPIDALHALDEALALALTCAGGQTSMYGLLQRWKAEALLALSRPGEAELALLDGLAVAQRQKARLFELGAATRLARLWQGQGRVEAAVRLLAARHEWFTEGHNTPLLGRAAELLCSLQGESRE